MTRGMQRLTACLIGVPAGLAIAVAVCILVAGYIGAVSRVPGDKERIDTLTKEARADLSREGALTAEFERQTKVSVRHIARRDKLINVLVVAAVLFLVCAKRFIALDGRPLPSPHHIQGLRTSGGGRAPSPEGCACAEAGASTPASADDVEQVDPGVIDAIIEKHGQDQSKAIPILHAVQLHYRYLPQPALEMVCERTEITAGQIAGVSSFYTQFRHAPVGEHIVKVCHGTACHVAGAPAINEGIRRYTGIATDTDTDPQRRFTIEEVACMGCCTLAPVVQIDGVTHGHLTPDAVPDALDPCLNPKPDGAVRRKSRLGAPVVSQEESKGEIRIGLGSCCVAGGSGKVYEALRDAVAASGATASIKRVGCVGMCHRTPLVETVMSNGATSLYEVVEPEDAKAIVRRHFRAKSLGRRLLDTTSSLLEDWGSDDGRGPVTHRAIEVRDPPVVAFLGPQKHIATEHCGKIDPTDFEEYLRHDGFKAFERCVKDLTPEEVIDEIERSGLRGKGGAGSLRG